MSHLDPGELHAYADGEIAERERARIEEHVAACEQCRARLEEAEKLSQRASNLLAELEPAPSSAPPWGAIEARSAAREPDSPRRNWLKPNLAWAASIALAFVLGWATSNYWELPRTAFDSPTVVTVAAPADEAGAPTSVDLVSTEEAALREVSETEPSASIPEAAGRRSSDADVRNEARRDQAPAELPPAEPARQFAQEEDRPAAAKSLLETGAARAAELAETEAQRERVVAAGEAADQAPLVQQFRVTGAVEPPADKAVDDFVRALDAQAAVADPSAGTALFDDRGAGEVRFFKLEGGEASAWLGGELQTLADLEAESVLLGPGAAIPGALADRPAVVIIYRDAAGHEIILVQQLVPGEELMEQSDDRVPAFTVEPSGRRAYRWRDERGYRLMLIGMIESDSLRALADRVR